MASLVHSSPQPRGPVASQIQVSSQIPDHLDVVWGDPSRNDENEGGVICYPLAQAKGEPCNNQVKQPGPRAAADGENPNLVRSPLHAQAEALCAPPEVAAHMSPETQRIMFNMLRPVQRIIL